MKKFFAVLMALILGLFSVMPAMVADVTVNYDLPEDTKAVLWQTGYKARCRKYNKTNVQRKLKKKHSFARKVLLAPLGLVCGVASASPASVSEQMMTSYACYENKEKKIRSKHFPKSEDALAAYEALAKKGYPCAMHWDTGKGRILCKAANKWHLGDEEHVAEEPLNVIENKFIDHNRAVLNPKFGPQDQNLWVFDVVRKQIPTTEEIVCDLLGGKVLFVESYIQEWEDANNGDLSALDIAETKQAEWERVIDNGLTFNNEVYRILGRGTNAAKECKHVFCTENVRDEAFEIMRKADPNWLTTPAKGVGYLFGLQNVCPKVWLDLPIKPEDFVFFDEIKEPVKSNIAFVKDGDIRYSLNTDTRPISKADGQILVHVSEKKRNEWIDELIAKGMGKRSARRLVDEQIEMLKNSFSARTRNAALKFSAIWWDFHAQWRDETGSDLINGRNIDDVVFIGDSSVRKTSVGEKEGTAFKTEAEWADTVRNDKLGKGFQLGILIQEDHLKIKDLPYQFLQHLYGAKDETIDLIIKKMIGKIRELHTMDGLLKYVPKELRFILKNVPILASFPMVQRRLQDVFYRRIDSILSGKYLEAGLYGQMHTDPAYQLQSYMRQDGYDVKVTGALDEGEICIIGDTIPDNEGEEGVVYRSPIATTGALKVMKTKVFRNGYDKYLDGCGPCIVFNAKDDSVTQIAGDFDGDHCGFCKDKVILRAVKEAQEKYGTWLPVSEAPNPTKELFTIKAMEEDAKGLTRPSELGKTMIEIVRILNGIREIWKGGKIVARVTFTPSINALMSDGDAGLNQVDASKHGNKTQKKHPDCRIQGDNGCLPKTKVYRNLIRDSKGQVDRKRLMAIQPEPENLCVGVLNKYFRGIRLGADCEFGIYGMPEASSTWKEEYEDVVLDRLMFDNTDKKSRRTLAGLTRKGDYKKSFGFCPNQGLWESLSRRGWATWKAIIGSDDGSRRMSHKEFVVAKRKQGLVELERFAQAYGKTLKDAVDVIIQQTIRYLEKNYPDVNEKEPEKGGLPIDEILKHDLWDSVLDILGGELCENIKKNTENFDVLGADLEIDDLDDLESDDESYDE